MHGPGDHKRTTEGHTAGGFIGSNPPKEFRFRGWMVLHLDSHAEVAFPHNSDV